MRTGIFSDVHGNLEALEAVIEAYKAESIDKYIFLGDAVGYGANPNECCHLIKNLAEYSILGNHDAACVDKLSYHWFNPTAKKAILWSQEQLSQENRQWLETLDYTLEFQGFLMSHGLPLNPDAFEYDDDILKIKLYFNRFGDSFSICFLGHTHRPIVILQQNDKKRILSVPAYLQGEYGIEGICLGVTILLGAQGIEKIFELKLTQDQMNALKYSASVLEEMQKKMLATWGLN